MKSHSTLGPSINRRQGSSILNGRKAAGVAVGKQIDLITRSGKRPEKLYSMLADCPANAGAFLYHRNGLAQHTVSDCFGV